MTLFHLLYISTMPQPIHSAFGTCTTTLVGLLNYYCYNQCQVVVTYYADSVTWTDGIPFESTAHTIQVGGKVVKNTTRLDRNLT